jgi:protein-S-isoprenylcysteine O-methyltransferase Ste14
VGADRTVVGPRAGSRWFLAGYAGVAGFLALEATVRQPGTASDLEASSEDDGSTRRVATAYALVVLGAPLLRRLRLRPLPAACGPLGLGILVGGLGLRVWSMQTLSESYSRTLRVTNEQSVTERGPYLHIRHPGYLGSLLIWAGFALASRSAAVFGAVAGLLVPAYARRIDAEERLLVRDLRGYEAYRARTKKVIPGMW